MGILDSLRNFKHKIDTIDSSVYNGKQSLIELYEINAKLEAQIEERTNELKIANQQMQTLQHIWNMMNSSKPLSSVLNAIVSSLQSELGYLQGCIVKKMTDSSGDYLRLEACSGDFFGGGFQTFFNCEPNELRMEYPNNDILAEVIENGKIFQSKDILKLVKSVLPKISEDVVNQVLKRTGAKSYILVPLTYKHLHFGSLIVYSSREEASDNELNFLSLFAQQIEMAITIADLFEAVKEQAITDPMTGLYNRRYFEDFIKKEAVRAERQNQKFTVIGIDLDHLKEINDVYGHNYGDIAINAVANVLKSSCRSIDIAARMGGEEFNVILPGVDSQGGLVFAERIRRTIESVTLDKIGQITGSLGVATYLEQSDDIHELLEIVDHAMYESKRTGRNKVTLAQPVSETSWQEVAIDTFIDILSKHRIPIDKTTAHILNKKLQEMNINNEILYHVADTLVSTYNPEHVSGIAQKKVRFATSLAKYLNLDKSGVDRLKVAMLLYDIGNTMIPKELLEKKEPLTDEDRQTIKQHPIIAAREILEPISFVGDIIPIIEKHHENWNGTGYPNKLAGENIPVESQIILIIDSFFALLENRPYRKALTKDEAIKTIMDEAGSKWNIDLAKAFVSIIQDEENNQGF